MRTSTLAVVLAIGLASTTGAAEQKGLDACALLTRAEAEAAVGATVGEPDRQGGPTAGITLSTCQYFAKPRTGVVRLSAERYDSADLLKMVTEDFGKEDGDEMVPGLGQRAVWRSRGDVLKVIVDRDLLSLTLVPVSDGKAPKEKVVALMRKVLARR
jgi:hypothetical protein